MSAKLKDDSVLSRFRAAVGGAYGDRLERVVLFGSRARGDHRPNSDYDIAVFIRNPGDLWDELARGYELKSIVDYDSSRTTPPISAERANSAIDTAERFIDAIANLLATDPPAASDSQPE